MLLDVQGVGPQTARMVLSAFTPVELKNIVLAEDVRMLKSVKGIGPKAAARIVMDLKDKVVALAGNESGGGGKDEAVATAPAVVEEAVQALAVLGFSPAPTHKVVMQIVKDEPALQVEQIIKKALKML